MLLITLVACLVVASQADKKPEEWRLVWEDNFDFFDSSKWDHEVTAWGGGVSINYQAKLFNWGFKSNH